MRAREAAKKVCRRLALWVLLIGAVVMLARLTSLAESKFFYFPDRSDFPDPPGAENVFFETDDGVRLHGWLLRPAGASPDAKVPAVLHVHGNAGNIDSHLGFSRFLTEHGLAVFIFDYRGYGRSAPGRPERFKLMRDTRAALGALKQQAGIDPDRLGVYGVSLGGTFALNLAAEEPSLRGACIVSAFSSWNAIASDHGSLLGRALIAGGLDADDAAAKLGARPLLLVHGLADTIIAPAHSRRLAEAARKAGVPTSTLFVPGRGHNDILENNPELEEAIAAFFRDHLQRP